MRNSQISAWLFATILVGLYVLVLVRAFSPMRDPNGYDSMVAFFFGVPLAIAATVSAYIGLRQSKDRSMWVPLIVGLLPIVGWPSLFVLEALRIVP